MTLLQSMLGVQNAGPESPTVPLTAPSLLSWLTGPSSASGVTVNERTVSGIPAFWRAVTLTAGVSASLPLHAVATQGSTRTVLDNHPAADFLEEPHPDLTRFELVELLIGSLAFHGDAVFRKLRDGSGRLREIWPLPATQVTIERDKHDLSKRYTIEGDSKSLTDREIWHVPGFGLDGTRGMSIVKAFRNGLGLSLAMESYGSGLFARGSLATGIVSVDRPLTPETARTLKERWQATIGRGLEGAHEVAILENGAKFQQLTINPEDAQFLDSRRFSVQEIGRMTGVPPHLLMDTSTSTSWGTGLEQMTLGWVKFSLQPYWLTRVEQRLTRLLRTEFGQTGPRLAARWTLEGLLRGDSEARAAFYRAMWELGAFDTNEIRALEDLDPVDGGDLRWRPLNFGPLGQVDDPAAPAPAPPAVPADPEGAPADA